MAAVSSHASQQEIHGSKDTLQRKRYYTDFLHACSTRYPVIAGINSDHLLDACANSTCDMVYILYGNVCTIPAIVQRVKDMGKMAIVHIDLVAGLSSHEMSVNFIDQFTRADGIISTKPHLIQRGNELGMFTIQRFFLLDRITYDNVKKHVKRSSPDVIEVMPAGLTKMIRYVKEEIEDQPLIASGLILDREDVSSALAAGAIAISTTNTDLWVSHE